jgi:hypothetical protein
MRVLLATDRGPTPTVCQVERRGLLASRAERTSYRSHCGRRSDPPRRRSRPRRAQSLIVDGATPAATAATSVSTHADSTGAPPHPPSIPCYAMSTKTPADGGVPKEGDRHAQTQQPASDQDAATPDPRSKRMSTETLGVATQLANLLFQIIRWAIDRHDRKTPPATADD